jgi:hypothetical protein
MLKKHSKDPESFHNKLETICRDLNIVRECYHGGKYNGVNCIKIMKENEEIFEQASQILIEMKTSSLTEDEVRQKCSCYSSLLNTLDAIWKHVSSIEKGLLPTDANIEELDNLLCLGKQRWLDMGMTTEQPKWHLTFDGVLLRQVTRYRGLADKGDAPIELGHQIFGRLHERFRRASTFKRREKFIMRSFRVRSHPECQRALNEMNRKRPRHDDNNPRQQRRRLRLVAEVDAKHIKREKALEEPQT